jgi:hypothetical protein
MPKLDSGTATSRQSDGFTRMLTFSLSVSVAAFAGMALLTFGYLRTHNPSIYDLYFDVFVFALPALWTVLVLVAFFRYRLRGLWFLIGMPFAMIWPAFDVLIRWACRKGGC